MANAKTDEASTRVNILPACRRRYGGALSIDRAFVVHLGPRGDSRRRRFQGRVEHLPSGRSAVFSSLKELLRFLSTTGDGSMAAVDRSASKKGERQ